MPLPSILTKYIVRTEEKVNKSNLKTFCKACIEVLGEEEGRKISFPNKTDRIVQHLKKCSHFFTKTNEEERAIIFALSRSKEADINNNIVPSLIPSKRSFVDSTTSSQQSLQSHKIINRSSCYGPMDNFIVRSLSKEDFKKFHMLLLRLTVSCGWALSWVNKPEAKELFEFLNPFLKLPDRRVLGGDILNKVVSELDDAMEIALKEDPVGVTLTFDEGKPYVWKAVDISSERENYVGVMNKTEKMLEDLKKKEITVCAIVTDSASAYAAARRRLRILNRSIVFLPCFAHQLNLCVGEIFKESTEFKTSIDRAIRLATYFKNANHKFFIAKLRDQQRETYKKYIAIAVPGETRWNSLYDMCISLLKTQRALQILAINYEPPIVASRRQVGEEPTLPRGIFEIINSPTFWNQITNISQILDPYCKLLNVLQRDKARLFQVVHSMGYLVQFWLNYSDTTLASKMIDRLEKRWNEWEQPLLLLSYLLHPEYRMEQFNNSVSNVNYSEFGKWLMYYYRAWSEKEPKCILSEFNDFRLAQYPFDLDTYRQFNNDIWRYWCFASVSTNELGFVACRIFSICVNAASVERLWSCMGFLQSKRRNRLMSNKALSMSKLRADITYSHRLYNNPLITESIIDADDSNVNQDPGNLDSINNPADNLVPAEENNSEGSDDEADEADELQLENEFGEYLQGWVEMLDEEKNAESNENSDENDDNTNNSTVNIHDVTHPAVDANAKWVLKTLFKDNINLPF
ncbi:unnamed protein product [Rhizophagus irregularis]|nr:unnamed protein product [Rhizophagus irregularis]